MRRHFLIAGLLAVGLLAGAGALAGAMEDITLQFTDDSVAVHNDGTSTVAVVVLRTCESPVALPGLVVPMVNRLTAITHAGQTTRIDRNRNGACTYAIKDARYVRKFGSVR